MGCLDTLLLRALLIELRQKRKPREWAVIYLSKTLQDICFTHRDDFIPFLASYASLCLFSFLLKNREWFQGALAKTKKQRLLVSSGNAVSHGKPSLPGFRLVCCHSITRLDDGAWELKRPRSGNRTYDSSHLVKNNPTEWFNVRIGERKLPRRSFSRAHFPPFPWMPSPNRCFESLSIVKLSCENWFMLILTRSPNFYFFINVYVLGRAQFDGKISFNVIVY